MSIQGKLLFQYEAPGPWEPPSPVTGTEMVAVIAGGEYAGSVVVDGSSPESALLRIDVAQQMNLPSVRRPDGKYVRTDDFLDAVPVPVDQVEAIQARFRAPEQLKASLKNIGAVRLQNALPTDTRVRLAIPAVAEPLRSRSGKDGLLP